MADRETIMTWLKKCGNGGCSSRCPYDDLGPDKCYETLMTDALKLLKEQMPVKPIKSKLSFTRGFMWEIWDCGCCGNQLRSFAKYCDQCGKAVKWDELEK